jgi:hypothetical protein
MLCRASLNTRNSCRCALPLPIIRSRGRHAASRNSDSPRSSCSRSGAVRRTAAVHRHRPIVSISFRREILLPESKTPIDARPVRADARGRLVVAISQGRKWFNELITGAAVDVDAIAAREGCSIRRVNMTISLAFLAPDLVKAAIEGRLPCGLGIARLRDPPAEWPFQYRKLGLTSS